MCLYVHVMCMHVLMEAREGVGSPQAEVIGGCEPSSLGAENQTWLL